MILLTYKDLSQATGILENTLRTWVHRGQMPAPDVQPNKRTAFWTEESIREWIEDNKGGLNGRPDRS